MKPSSLSIVVWIAFVVATLSGSRGVAQSTDESNRATARQLGTEGIEAFRVNDFPRADAKLEEAFRLYPTPTLGLWSGRARTKVGHWLEAAERFREATRISETVGENAAQIQAQRDAAAELKALLLRIPNLTIRLEAARPEDVIVTVDGAPIGKDQVAVARPLNPGVHHLTATRSGERAEADVLLAERDNKAHVFQFKAVAPVAPVTVATAPAVPEPQPALAPAPRAEDSVTTSKSNVLSYVAIGALAVGGAGLVTAGVTTVIANGKLDDCPRNVCAADVKDSYDSLRAVSIASFYIGGALAVGGLVTLLLAPKEADATRDHAHWSVGPGSVQVRGEF